MIILQNLKMPEVIDLFCGCGGLACGFQKAGFKIAGGLDIEEAAIQSASYNLHWRNGEETSYECLDITQTDSSVFADKIGNEGCIVIGGPPCQAYSLAGRAKLKSLGKHRENIRDKRGMLYKDFLRFALELNAKAVVMENVPESANFGGLNIPEIVCQELEESGYHAVWTLLNSADFGVPQTRERVFVLAVRKDIGDRISLPQPTHCGIRSEEKELDSAMRNSAGRIRTLSLNPHFVAPLKADPDLPDWNTVGDAISDLPVLFTNAYQKYSLERIDQRKPYRGQVINDFQRQMRSWYGLPLTCVTGNTFRKTLRDFPIFSRMKQGDNYAQASEIADRLLEEACIQRNIDKNINPEAYAQLKKQIVPPYDRENFLYKWTRLSESRPSHTLVAHLSIDTYSHIHPVEPRGISVREAARLQSFPDDFLFQTTMGDAFKQIGNAVPPLLALAIAKAMKKTLGFESLINKTNDA